MTRRVRFVEPAPTPIPSILPAVLCAELYRLAQEEEPPIYYLVDGAIFDVMQYLSTITSVCVLQCNTIPSKVDGTLIRSINHLLNMP